MSMVISITNRKGGTGKTTTSVNLSAEYSVNGRQVLLIDLDTQGHSGIGLGVIPDRKASTIHHVFVDSSFDINQAIYETKWKGLYIMPADRRFEHGRGKDDYNILKTALKRDGILERFDLIVIDTPPSLDNLLLNALCASDIVIAPFLPHYLSAEGVMHLSRVFYQVSSRYNPKLRLAGLLPVMFNHRVQQHKKVAERLSQHFGKKRILSGIRADIKLVEAFENKSPVRFYEPMSRGAIDYAIVAEEIENLINL